MLHHRRHREPKKLETIDPEITPPANKVDLRWYQYLNLFGLMRMFIGQTRDSTGHPNNVLMLFVGSCLVGAACYLGSVYYNVTYHKIILYCPKEITKPTSKKRAVTSTPQKSTLPTKVSNKATDTKERPSKVKGRRGRRTSYSRTLKLSGSKPKKTTVTMACTGNNITINATLHPTSPLIQAFYYSLTFSIVFLGMLYFGRHSQTRDWFVDLLYAWRGGPRRDTPQEPGIRLPPEEPIFDVPDLTQIHGGLTPPPPKEEGDGH